MAATSVNRAQYREYTRYLRVRADQLDMAVAPARLEQLRSRVNSERYAFHVWVAVWLLIAVACLLPLLMVLAVHFGWPIPGIVDGRAEALYSQLDTLNSGAANLVVIALGAMFIGALTIGYVPVLAHCGALNDLEHAHQTLRRVERS